MIVLGKTRGNFSGFHYDIPEKWIYPEKSSGKIDRMILSDDTGDPYWNPDTDAPYIFSSFSALTKFVKENRLENVRVFVMDNVYQNKQWHFLPVRELKYDDIKHMKGSRVSIHMLNPVFSEEKEDTNAVTITYTFHFCCEF